MREVVARRCSTKKLLLSKIHRKSVLESLSNTVKGLYSVTLATLLKRNSRSGVLEPVVRKYSLKKMILNNSQNSQENTCVWVYF